MPAKVIIIWDYDTPIARITTTRPYNYLFEKCLDESTNVDTILEYAKSSRLQMTFSIVGFGAEKSVFPFDIRDKIRKIHQEGHEVASHSWRHDWIPHLTSYQLEKTIERSKYILEDCLQIKDSVKGFVPPHDRPMSWPGKFAFSIGDRAFYPFHPGASIGYLLDCLRKQNFTWCRATYRPFWRKITDWKGDHFEKRLKLTWHNYRGIIHFRGTYCGFEEPVYKLMDKAVRDSLPIVITAHPAGLSRKGSENMELFDKFMTYLIGLNLKGDAVTFSVSQYIEKEGLLKDRL